jgi:hypothetical protein
MKVLFVNGEVVCSRWLVQWRAQWRRKFWWRSLSVCSVCTRGKFRFSSPLKKLGHSNHCTNTMLYLVGLGLGDETDITVKGLAIVRKATRVYLEA